MTDPSANFAFPRSPKYFEAAQMQLTQIINDLTADKRIAGKNFHLPAADAKLADITERADALTKLTNYDETFKQGLYTVGVFGPSLRWFLQQGRPIVSEASKHAIHNFFSLNIGPYSVDEAVHQQEESLFIYHALSVPVNAGLLTAHHELARINQSFGELAETLDAIGESDLSRDYVRVHAVVSAVLGLPLPSAHEELRVRIVEKVHTPYILQHNAVRSSKGVGVFSDHVGRLLRATAILYALDSTDISLGKPRQYAHVVSAGQQLAETVKAVFLSPEHPAPNLPTVERIVPSIITQYIHMLASIRREQPLFPTP